ncbi:MAG TPA: CBS domain-containing protein, partial [Burkholderiaceae bacterium]
AVLAGVLGAPLTATLFAFELTGDANALLPLLLACATAHGLSVLLMRRSIMTERIARRGRHVYREYGIDPQERAHVGEVMTSAVQSIPAELPVEQVAQHWFGTTQTHRAFPVVDATGRFLGMLDRAHLLQAPAAAQCAGDLIEPGDPPFALADETCRAAAQRMASTGHERLAVVKDALTRHLIGIISRSDLIKPAHALHEEEAVREGRSG